MRLIFRFLVFFILASGGFIAGAITASARNWLQPCVAVSVTNNSGQKIESLRIAYASSRTRGSLETGLLDRGESRKVLFFLEGEGSFVLEATLADGRVLKGGEGYVEAGYSSTQLVSDTGIVGKVRIGI